VSLPPEIPQAPNGLHAQQETENQLEEVQREMTGFERATLRWAKVAVGMSAVAAFFVCLQWWEMHQGGIDTHDLAVAAGKQADRMKDFADITKDQTDQTKTIAQQAGNQSATQLGQLNEIKATDRAFIFVKSVDTVIGPAINGDKAYAWNVAFENSGTTPTKDLTLAVKCGFGGQFGDPVDVGGISEGDGFHAMIGPKSVQLAPSRCAALANFVFQQSEKGWYVFGFARYKDVFRAQHLTEFCWQNRPYLSRAEEPHMAPCLDSGARFNCVDKECADYKKITESKEKPN
jgi:hypothetical protein